MNYCSHCGHPVQLAVPPGDSLPRHVCNRCGRVFYDNPRLVVGCLPRWQGRVLLCRRAIEPRRGYWTLPSGFMENGETIEEGALRETREEAGAEVRIVRLFSAFSLPFINQVYLMFLADLERPDHQAGPESEEVRLLELADVPWEQIAFRAIEFTLERYIADASDGSAATVHLGSYDRRQGDGWTLRGARGAR